MDIRTIFQLSIQHALNNPILEPAHRMSDNEMRAFSPISKIIGKLGNRAWRSLARFRSAEAVFTEIYRNNLWGGEPGEPFSGGGSSEQEITDPYVQLISSHAERFGFSRMNFVDLGCGDMRVGRRLAPLCKSYVGVDVVKYLIDRHQDALGDEKMSFKHLDITAEPIPEGDVCFVRQVFQHLSNKQIKRVLPQLRKFRYVYITEHVPVADRFSVINLDKPPGSGIRLDRGSGVKLGSMPFGIPSDELEVILETPGSGGDGSDGGVIQTVLYTPRPL